MTPEKTFSNLPRSFYCVTCDETTTGMVQHDELGEFFTCPHCGQRASAGTAIAMAQMIELSVMQRMAL